MNGLNEQKELLKNVFVKMLETNIEITRFQLSMVKEAKQKDFFNNMITKSEKAISIIKGIEHYEILVSLYNSFVCNREVYFATLSATIYKEDTIEKWDKTEDGFREFQELEKEAIAQTDKEEKEKRELAEKINEARKQGKKVELMYENGKVRPIIISES